MKKSPEDPVANLQANMSIDRRTTLKLIGGAGFCVGTMSPVFASGRGAVLDTMRRARPRKCAGVLANRRPTVETKII